MVSIGPCHHGQRTCVHVMPKSSNLKVKFLIEIFLRYSPEFESENRIFTKPGMIKEIMFNILSLENQLPIFILEDLFKLANPTLPEIYNEYSLSQYTSFSFKNICED
ncbi:hypothetical protein JRO89_XS02G0281700 [Xanthoceras sorbifolium]|uniref:Uncharacterized protein n=1 Tax=Xanthoceras sorbifolium TaxID=99658 RepID=A0ABQ8IHC3_9ROSI|nr:hypothetical protein JRO89_XS02G0281700 [Xanthoceras sorbifolium]